MCVRWHVCKCAYVLHCCNIVAAAAAVVDAYFVISYDVFFFIVCANTKRNKFKAERVRERVRKKTSVERENKLRCDDDDGETATAVQSIISFSV